LTSTELEAEWSTAVVRRIELRSIDQSTSVVHHDVVATLRLAAAVLRLELLQHNQQPTPNNQQCEQHSIHVEIHTNHTNPHKSPKLCSYRDFDLGAAGTLHRGNSAQHNKCNETDELEHVDERRVMRNKEREERE
jgi:hypothetical protein